MHIDEIEIIKRGAVDIVSERELKNKLERGKPLRVKFGVDPTSSDIHLGHTVILRKLKQFQELGHEVIFIIGDFTARIGDPTGRQETRKQLSEGEIFKNAKTYEEQVFKILDKAKTKVVYNSCWLHHMSIEEIVKLTSNYTVARMLERADFKKRYQEQRDISILEFLYPLLQGYDSIVLGADVEVGGTDQIFNLLVGRDLQQSYNQPPQVVITMPILEGTDGMMKMSKSYGNFIGITESPSQIFGKLMSIPDNLMIKYFELLTDLHQEEIEEIKEGLKEEKLHPKSVKKKLAREIVTLYHGREEAQAAEEEFERVFRDKKLPKEMPQFTIQRERIGIIELLLLTQLVSSKSQARRLILQGGVKLDKVRITDPEQEIDSSIPRILQVGKRRFVKVLPS
jgi:tyrosyl-tRNA synthetase